MSRHIRIKDEANVHSISESPESKKEEGGSETLQEVQRRLQKLMAREMSPRTFRPTSSASPSEIDLLQKEMVVDCGGKDLDACKHCIAQTKDGRKGHLPWDELELMRHGWVTDDAKHFSPNMKRKDELCLLHDGVTDAQGHHNPTPIPPPPAPSLSIEPMSTMGKEGHVGFGSRREVTIPDTAGWGWDEGAETSISEDSLAPVQRRFPIRGGGELTEVISPTTVALLLQGETYYVYTERGPEELVLVMGRADENGTWTNKRLEMHGRLSK